MAGRWQNLYDLNIRFRFEEIRQLIYQGYRDYEVAKQLELTPRALRELRKKYPEFDDVFKGAKKYLAKKINEAMVKNALGYDYNEETYEEIIYPDGTRQQKKKVTKKHSAPDVGSGIFLLCNYDGENFKRKDSNTTTMTDNVRIIDDLSEVEIDD